MLLSLGVIETGNTSLFLSTDYCVITISRIHLQLPDLRLEHLLEEAPGYKAA